MEVRNDKESVVDINERLHYYVRRVRQLKNESDLDVFYNSINALESEIKEIKKNFEAELAKLNYAIEILNSEKIELEKDIIERKNIEAHLNDRLNVEVEKCSRYNTEINYLKNEIVDKDYKIRELHMTLNQAYYENSGMKKEVEDQTKIINDLQHRLSMSKSEYQDTISRLKIVEEKLSFQESFTEERMSELKRRIETYLINIAELENKLQQAEMRENLFPEQLKQVKEDSAMEINTFKKETGEYYKSTIETLENNIDKEQSENKQLQQQTEFLISKMDELRKELAEAKSNITTLEQQKRILTQNIETERHENVYRINTLEKKMKELQQSLAVHVEEANKKQDVNDSLRTELDAMQLLLSEEEGRLGLSKKPLPPPGTNEQQKSVVEMKETVKTEEIGFKKTVIAESPEDNVETQNKEMKLDLLSNFQESENSDEKNVEPLTPRPENDKTQKVNNMPTYTKTRDKARKTSTLAKESSTKNTEKSVKKSAGSSRSNKRQSARRLGEGRDYFEEMFDDNLATQSGQQSQSFMKSSALGDIKILEVSPDGLFVRILNSNEKQEFEFSNYSLKQVIGGHPIAVFRFPYNTKISPNGSVTIWSGSNEPKIHKPPADFHWSEYNQFNTKPECTTVVCDSAGNAVAWTTAYHRYNKDAYLIITPTASTGASMKDFDEEDDDDEELENQDENNESFLEGPSVLQREKAQPYYVTTKHPYAHYTGESIHPKNDRDRTELWNNDNCSVNRQSRNQSSKSIDKIPGEPYAGADNQILGPARVFKHYPATLQRSISGLNRAPDVIMRSCEEIPSPFASPQTRNNYGMRQVQSMHNSTHLPPMPKPEVMT